MYIELELDMIGLPMLLCANVTVEFFASIPLVQGK
jgi:hypothetical protein